MRSPLAAVAVATFIACTRAKTPTCDPMLPTEAKLRTLRKHFDSDSAALVMWRLMKSGTSSACGMLNHEYRTVRHLEANQTGTCGGPWMEVFAGTLSWDELHRTRGFSFLGSEPAIRPGWFPVQYHSFAEPYLNPSSSSPTARSRVWNEFVHILTVRHPLERALSAFNFRHASQFDVLGVCSQGNVTTPQACLNLCLELCEGDPVARAFFEERKPRTANMIASQVCGNFLVAHLSHNGSIAVARQNMQRFSIIIDITSLPTISSTLLQCVLGWTMATGVPHVNQNHASGQLELADLSRDVVDRLRRLMRDDLVLYDEAISLMIDHHRAATVAGKTMVARTSHDPSRVTTLPVTRGSIRVDVADEDDDDPLELVETACRWVPDAEHFANVSSRGCCPHAVTVYGERYGSIDARCCRDDHHRSISPLRLECDATDTATPLLGSLSNRTVVFLGDSIAEQYFVGTACALWEDGEHVEIADSMPESAYLVNGTKSNGPVLRAWTARVAARGLMLRFVRQDPCGHRPCEAKSERGRDEKDALGRADVIFTVPLHEALRLKSAERILKVQQLLRWVEALISRERTVYKLIGAPLPHHFPASTVAEKGCVTALSDAVFFPNRRDMGGDADPNATILAAARRVGWRAIRGSAPLMAEHGDFHVGDVSAYKPGVFDCVHFCALPGVLSSFGWVLAAAVAEIDRHYQPHARP